MEKNNILFTIGNFRISQLSFWQPQIKLPSLHSDLSWIIVHKEVPSTPLFKAPNCWPSLPPFLKLLFPLPFFLLYPLWRYFRQFTPPSCRQHPSCSNLTFQPSLHIHTSSFLGNLEWLFFINLWWHEKIIFLQIYNTILQRVK